MEKVQICIIKPNTFNIDKLPKLENKIKELKDEPYFETDYKKKLNYADIEKFKEITKDFIEIKEVSIDKIMIEIEDTIKSSLDYVNVTEDIYECRNYLYQMCFVDKYHNECNKEDLNYLASALTTEDKAIVGNIIILKEYIPNNNLSTKLESITYKDIYFLIMNELVHAGVIIQDNSKLIQIYYNNKLQLVNLDKSNTINNLEKNNLLDENYEGYKASIIKFDFNIYVRKSDTYEKGEINFNGLAAKLYNMKIEGDSIFICNDVESDKYYDLFIEDITDLLKVDISKRKLIKKDYEEKKDKNNLKIFNGRYRLLYNKLNKC